MNQRIGLTVPKEVTFIETFMADFNPDDRLFRDTAMEQALAANTAFVVVDLPVRGCVKGPGLHYVRSLLAGLREMGEAYPEVGMLPVVASHWGSPVAQNRMWVVAGPRKLPPPPTVKETVVTDAFPEIVYHSNSPLDLRTVKQGLFPKTAGVAKSSQKPFADAAMYGPTRPVVAKVEGGSYVCGTLTPAEWASVFGVEHSPEHPLQQAELGRITPTKVVNRVLNWLVHTHA